MGISKSKRTDAAQAAGQAEWCSRICLRWDAAELPLGASSTRLPGRSYSLCHRGDGKFTLIPLRRQWTESCTRNRHRMDGKNVPRPRGNGLARCAAKFASLKKVSG